MAKMSKKKTQKPIPASTPINPTIDHLAEEIAEKRTAFESDQTPYRNIWKRALKDYEMIGRAPKFDWQSSVVVPVVYRDFRTIYPRIKEIVCGPIPLVKYVGNQSGELDKAVSYYLRKCSGYKALSDISFEACLFGSGFGKLIMDFQLAKVIRKVPKIDPGKDIIKRAERMIAGLPETEEFDEVEDDVVTANRPAIYHIPLLNIKANCNDVSDIDDADIIEDKFVTLEYLVQRSRDPKVNPLGYKSGCFDNVDVIAAFVNLEKSETGLPESENGKTMPDSQDIFRQIRGEATNNADSVKNWIMLLTYQGDFYHDGVFYHNGIVNIAQVTSRNNKSTRNITLRVMPCQRSDGRKNYVMMRYESIPGRFYGAGIGQRLASHQDAATNFFRAQMNRETMSLHAPMGYNANLVDEPKLLLLRMGALIPCNGPPSETLQQFTIPPPDGGAWAFLDKLSQSSAEISGSKNLSEVEKPGSNRTSSGIGMVMGAAAKQILMTARDMVEEFIAGPNGIGYGFLTLIQDNLKGIEKPIKFTYVNNKGQNEIVQLDPDKLTGEYDVYAPSIFERNDKQQDAQTLLQLIPGIAGQIGEENLLELMRTVWEYLELPNGDKLFAPNQQSIPIEIVMLILKQMGVDPGQFGAMLNQMAQSKGKTQGQGGGGETPQGQRTAAKPSPSQNQGTASVQMPNMGANTGMRRA